MRLSHEDSERRRLEASAVRREVCYAMKEGAEHTRRRGDDANVIFKVNWIMGIWNQLQHIIFVET